MSLGAPAEHRNDSDEPEEEQLKQEPEQEPAQEPEETLGASSGGGGAPSPARTRQPLVTRLERARGTSCAREAVVFFFSVIISINCPVLTSCSLDFARLAIVLNRIGRCP